MVVCISECEQRLTDRTGLPGNRLEVLSPGVDLTEFERVRGPFYTRYGIDASRDAVLLFVSRVAPEKGLPTLIRAFAEALRREPALVLAIVGPDLGYQRQVEALATALRCGEKVVFTGPASREDLIAAYQQATVFVFPTEYEAFGIVLIEAMAAGLPVVASRAAAVPFVVADGETGLLFHFRDHLEMSRHILDIVWHGSLQTALSKEARRQVERRFDQHSQLLKVEQIYDSVLGKHRVM